MATDRLTYTAGIVELEPDVDELTQAWLEYDDPLEAEQAQWEALSPEKQAAELNECSDYMGSRRYWVVEDGELVSQVEPQPSRRLMRVKLVHGRMVRRRLPLPLFLRAKVRPRSPRSRRLARIRSSGRSSRDGPGEPPEPPLHTDLAGPGTAWRLGVEAAA